MNFKEEMDNELNKVGRELIVEKVKEYCNFYKDSEATVPIYRIKTKLCYTGLSKNIERINC